MVNNEDYAKLKVLADCLRIIADLTDSVEPLHQAQLLIEVARASLRIAPQASSDEIFDNRVNIGDLADSLGISSSASSRNVAALGDWNRKQRPGYGLVTTKLHPDDRRRKAVVLTRKGETVINQLLEKL